MWNRIVIILSLLCGIYLYFVGTIPERIVFLNVGQGDTALVEIGELKILIDTGFDMQSIWGIDKYISLNDREIDIVILTHPHFDHYGGIYQVLSRYDVGEIWVAKGCEFPYLEELVFEYGVEIIEVYGGMVWDNGGVRLEVLSPYIVGSVEDGSTFEQGTADNSGGFACGNSNELNNESLVVRLTYEEQVVLFMGDAEMGIEIEILDYVSKVDVLKVGHHCSQTSSILRFVNKVMPEVSICSYGEGNSYGHPSGEVVERLEGVGSEVWKTARDGDYVYVFE